MGSVVVLVPMKDNFSRVNVENQSAKKSPYNDLPGFETSLTASNAKKDEKEKKSEEEPNDRQS